MAKFSKILLSGSVNGKLIAVAALASPGTLIHQAVEGVDALDEIHLWIANVTGSAATLTIEWGGLNTADLITKSTNIAANSAPAVVISGLILQNSLRIRAYSDTANALNLYGYVNRIE